MRRWPDSLFFCRNLTWLTPAAKAAAPFEVDFEPMAGAVPVEAKVASVEAVPKACESIFQLLYDLYIYYLY